MIITLSLLLITPTVVALLYVTGLRHVHNELKADGYYIRANNQEPEWLNKKKGYIYPKQEHSYN
ncbi:MAG: hypothetical protein UR51_C0002G0121 [Candidatus Moranbacteria bacterium GW2011_GWF1_34_10]|nr:MAG: hypothetical protein UR51_C0002G0121 [Candidatus Moranbacteria bacterium GW2011_GWF1_34_10]